MTQIYICTRAADCEVIAKTRINIVKAANIAAENEIVKSVWL